VVHCSFTNRARSRTALVSAFICAALLAGFADAASAKCGGGHSRVTLGQRGDVKIYAVNARYVTDNVSRVYICSRRYQNAILVGNRDEDDFRRLTVRGEYAAFVHFNSPNAEDGYTVDVEVVNLRTGHITLGSRRIDDTAPRLRLCDVRGPAFDCDFEPVGRLHVTFSGSVAFAAKIWGRAEDLPKKFVGSAYGIYRYEVSPSLRTLRRTAVDHVLKKEMKTVWARDGVMHWHGHGRLKSAPIR
jgi:hypothetical protein